MHLALVRKSRTFALCIRSSKPTPYLKAAENAGMTEADRTAAIDILAANPQVGDLIVGTGGCRKVRLAGRGKGKSGGYRLITFYASPGIPVWLLTVFSKGDRANLTKAERNGLAALAKAIVQSSAPAAVTIRS